MWDFQFKSIDWRKILFSISFAWSSPRSLIRSFLVSWNLFEIFSLKSLSFDSIKSLNSVSSKLFPTICLVLLLNSLLLGSDKFEILRESIKEYEKITPDYKSDQFYREIKSKIKNTYKKILVKGDKSKKILEELKTLFS